MSGTRSHRYIDTGISSICDRSDCMRSPEQRMQHMLIAAKGLEQASNQLQRLETIQAQIALKRAILDDEQALKLILELI